MSMCFKKMCLKTYCSIHFKVLIALFPTFHFPFFDTECGHANGFYALAKTQLKLVTRYTRPNVADAALLGTPQYLRCRIGDFGFRRTYRHPKSQIRHLKTPQYFRIFW